MPGREKRPQWMPGSGMRPTVDEARDYDAWAREDPAERWPIHDSTTYAQMGFRTGDPNIQGQTELDLGGGPGVAKPRHRYHRTWGDIHERKVKVAEARETGQEPTQKMGRQDMEAREADIGVTPDRMSRRAAYLLDTSQERAGVSGIPEGREFYSRTERPKIGEMARRQDVSFETAAGAVAATSPQVPWQKYGRDTNIEVAETAVEHAVKGRPGIPKTETGLPDQIAVAMELTRNPGADVSEYTKDGPKIKSFEQNFVTPYHPENRATVDAHMVEGLTEIPLKKDRENFLGRAGNYEMVSDAIESESARRGLAVEEGQSVMWHQQKYLNEAGITGRDARGMARARVAAASSGDKPAVSEIPGQLDIAGEPVINADPFGTAEREQEVDRRYRRSAPPPPQYTDEDYRGQPM